MHKYRSAAWAFFFLAAAVCTFGQLNLTGKVTDVYGMGLGGASVHLKVLDQTATSGTDGTFTFSITSAEGRMNSSSLPGTPAYSEGQFHFSITSHPRRVRIELFNLESKRIGTPVSRILAPGRHSIDAFAVTPPAQVYMARVQTGGETFSYRLTGGKLESVSPAGITPPLPKQAGTSAVVDTLEFSLTGYITAEVPVDEFISHYEVALTSTGPQTGRKYFYMFPAPQRMSVTLPNPDGIDFNSVMNGNGYIYPSPFSAQTISTLNLWARELIRSNPFEGYANGEVPWMDVHDNQNANPYIFITQEQLAYLFVLNIFGAGFAENTGLAYARNYDGSDNIWMFSVLNFLTTIMQSDAYRTTYVGLAFGGYDQAEGMAEIMSGGMAGKTMAPLNVCYFDNSEIMVRSDISPMSPDWCVAEQSVDEPGASFHSVDIPGQAVVDIGGSCYGGGTSCPGCHLAGSQDESMPAFYPETIGFSFFMRERANNNGLICSPGAIAFLGVRRYMDHLNGSHNILGGLCGSPRGTASEFLTATVSLNVKDSVIRLYDHSMVFVASLLNGDLNLDFSNYYTRKRKECATSSIGLGDYDFTNYCGGGLTSPLMDIGKWYGAFTPGSYHTDIGDVITGLYRRIGTFNWGAGVWWGDPQEYFLINWLATSFLDNVVLDYYLFNSPCENAGVQCSMLTGTQCSDCYANSMYSPFTETCPSKDAGDIFQSAKNLDAEAFMNRLKAGIRNDGHLFDHF